MYSIENISLFTKAVESIQKDRWRNVNVVFPPMRLDWRGHILPVLAAHVAGGVVVGHHDHLPALRGQPHPQHPGPRPHNLYKIFFGTVKYFSKAIDIFF